MPKDPKGKLRWHLMPWEQLDQVMQAIESKNKPNGPYVPDDWKEGNPVNYKDAMLRHMVSYLKGEKKDPQSGMHPLSHMISSALYVMWHDQNPKNYETGKDNPRRGTGGIKEGRKPKKGS